MSAKPRLLEQVREALRFRHYSYRAEAKCRLDTTLHPVPLQAAMSTRARALLRSFAAGSGELIEGPIFAAHTPCAPLALGSARHPVPETSQDDPKS